MSVTSSPDAAGAPTDVVDEPTRGAGGSRDMGEDHAPEDSDPTNVVNGPAPAAGDPAEVPDDPAPAAGDPAEVTDGPADAVDDPAHAVDGPAHASADANGPAPPQRTSPPIPRHPLLGATIAALTVLSFAVFGFQPEAVIAAFAAGALAVLAAIDIEHRVLPNRILFPALGVVLVAQVAVAPDRAVEWLLAGLAAAAFLALPLIIRRDAMGMGDVKLALLLGAIVGWKVFGAIVVGCFAMLPVALFMLVRDGSIKGATLPFGPFLAFGTLLILFTS